MNTKILKEIVNINSVTGNTENIINYIKGKTKGLPSRKEKNAFILGNHMEAKLIISLHVDEVGIKLSKSNYDYSVEPVGMLTPEMIFNSIVEVNINESNIIGFSYAINDIPFNELGFNDLRVRFLDKIARTSFYATYKKVFEENDEYIFSSSLDNKVSLFMILEMLGDLSELIENNNLAIIFIEDEEETYDSLKALAKDFCAEYAIVLDMMPINQNQLSNDSYPNEEANCSVIYKMHDYVINDDCKQYLPKIHEQVIIIDAFSPEQSVIDENKRTKTIAINIPLIGFHGPMYSLKKRTYSNHKKSLLEIINNILHY